MSNSREETGHNLDEYASKPAGSAQKYGQSEPTDRDLHSIHRDGDDNGEETDAPSDGLRLGYPDSDVCLRVLTPQDEFIVDQLIELNPTEARLTNWMLQVSGKDVKSKYKLPFPMSTPALVEYTDWRIRNGKKIGLACQVILNDLRAAAGRILQLPATIDSQENEALIGR